MGNTKNRISGFLYNFLDKDMHCKIQILVLRKKLLKPYWPSHSQATKSLEVTPFPACFVS